MLISSRACRELILELLLDRTVTIRLITDDPLTISANGDFGLSDFTETDVAGYSAQTMTGTDWTTTHDEAFTIATGDDQTFEPTAAVTATGYVVTYHDGTDDVALWAEELDPHATVPSAGGTIQITPRFDSRTRTT